MGLTLKQQHRHGRFCQAHYSTENKSKVGASWQSYDGSLLSEAAGQSSNTPRTVKHFDDAFDIPQQDDATSSQLTLPWANAAGQNLAHTIEHGSSAV